MTKNIIATYKIPNYSHSRVMSGINYSRNVSHPDGFKTEIIRCTSLEDLENKISNYKISFEHYGPSRPLKMSDCNIKVYEDEFK